MNIKIFFSNQPRISGHLVGFPAYAIIYKVAMKLRAEFLTTYVITLR